MILHLQGGFSTTGVRQDNDRQREQSMQTLVIQLPLHCTRWHFAWLIDGTKKKQSHCEENGLVSKWSWSGPTVLAERYAHRSASQHWVFISPFFIASFFLF